MSAEMEFNKIKDEVKALGCEALRADKDDYFEAVFTKAVTAKLNESLKSFLGEPVWPSKDKLALQIQDAIAGFGGIHEGQTLYFRTEGSIIIFAMLWPWGDGQRVTIKIIHK